MKVLFVTGDRYWNDPVPIQREFDKIMPEFVVVGDASGADALTRREADLRHISLIVFKAQWDLYGRAAGPIRNKKMRERLEVSRADGDEIYCRVFHSDLPNSKGTKNMVHLLERFGFDYEVIT